MNADRHPFIGREDEIQEFKKVLKDPAGRVILVTGQALMGKTFLLNRMARVAEAHPYFRCTCLRYEIAKDEQTSSLMLELVDDISSAAQDKSKGIRSFLNKNRDKLNALFFAGQFLLRDGLRVLGHLLTSFAEEAKNKGNARHCLGKMLNEISRRMTDNSRLLVFIDPNRYMPEGCADSWRLVVRDLPPKVIFIFAQRPSDQLISDP